MASELPPGGQDHREAHVQGWAEAAGRAPRRDEHPDPCPLLSSRGTGTNRPASWQLALLAHGVAAVTAPQRGALARAAD